MLLFDMVLHRLLIFDNLSLRDGDINNRYLDCFILFLNLNLLLYSLFYMRELTYIVYLLLKSDFTSESWFSNWYLAIDTFYCWVW